MIGKEYAEQPVQQMGQHQQYVDQPQMVQYQQYPGQMTYMQQPPQYGGPAVIVAQPMQQMQTVTTSPNNHSAFAWVVFLLCFWPLGLVAIIKSFEVNSAMARGDLQGAQQASESAKKFSIAGLIVGIFSWVIGVIFIILYYVFWATSITYYSPYY